VQKSVAAPLLVQQLPQVQVLIRRPLLHLEQSQSVKQQAPLNLLQQIPLRQQLRRLLQRTLRPHLRRLM
jgi:hypothetical protein